MQKRFVAKFLDLREGSGSFGSRLLLVLTAAAILLNTVPVLPFETDQYNLPPQPLADIGDEVSEYVEQNVIEAVATVNSEIDKNEACLAALPARPNGCDKEEKERKHLARLRSNDAVAREVYERLGKGDLFVTAFGNWMRAHKFRTEPSSYKAGYVDSIFATQPLDYATISPTVRLYGVEFGIDKLEHLFQQGFKYYELRRDALEDGKDVIEAERKAVKWGRFSEKTFFGMLVSGVYSNADLYSNYAGMKFYVGLTSDVKIGEEARAATLRLARGKWNIDPSTLRAGLLKPFVTEHLNEAMNPSGYAFNIFPNVRRTVRRVCPEWKSAFPMLTAGEIDSRSKALETWHGENYGFSKRSRSVSIAEMCF